jgi:hypothetical protein
VSKWLEQAPYETHCPLDRGFLSNRDRSPLQRGSDLDDRVQEILVRLDVELGRVTREGSFDAPSDVGGYGAFRAQQNAKRELRLPLGELAEGGPGGGQRHEPFNRSRGALDASAGHALLDEPPSDVGQAREHLANELLAAPNPTVQGRAADAQLLGDRMHIDAQAASEEGLSHFDRNVT